MLPVYTNDQIANYLTSGFAADQGYTQTRWNVATGGALTVNIGALAAAGQFFANAALKTWSEITGISFTFTLGVAQISFFDDGVNSAYASDRSTNGIFTTSAEIHISQDWLFGDEGNLNTYSYQTYLHEIGHALGLGHGGNYDGSATYDLNLGTAGHNKYLNDSWQTTIMSYFSQTENTYLNPVGGTSTAGKAYVLTPMVADILAIQSFYGSSTTAHTGNTVYGFNATAGNAIFDASQITGASYTIADSNGVDTMDYSGYTQNQLINLNAETFSDIGGVKGSVTIARGTVIENAIGGSGNDTIVGNTANNTFKGGAGTDTLDGGAGSDTADYSDKTSSVVVTLNGATVATVTVNGIAEDTIKNIENLMGGTGNDVLIGDGLANNFNGGLGNDIFYVGGGADQIDGGDGDDFIAGGTGGDTIVGGNGQDAVSYYYSAAGVTVNLITTINTGGDAQDDTLSGVENIYASQFNDVLIGDGKANIFSGYTGNDSFQGGTGGDYIDGGTDIDTAFYTDSLAGVFVNLGLTTVQTSAGDASGDILVNIENLGGSVFADVLIGSSVNNAISSGAGNDIIYGGDGADRIDGGANDDFIVGGAGADTIEGNSGNDLISYFNSAAGVTVNLSTNVNVGGDAQGDDISGIEGIYGSGGNDVLTGNADANILAGLNGNDLFLGGAGSDYIDGGLNTDTASYVGSNAGVTVNLALAGAQSSAGDASGDILLNIENLLGSSFVDVLVGNSSSNSLDGAIGNDIIYAGDGSDILIGGAGDDFMVGGNGNDTFVFGVGLGRDYINDFQAGVGLTDVVSLSVLLGLNDFSQVVSRSTQVGSDSIISLDTNNTITLRNVALGNLSSDDFIFV